MNTGPASAAAAKAEIAKKRERDAKVRAYENDRAKAGNNSMIMAESVMDETVNSANAAGAANPNSTTISSLQGENLNNLWKRLRYFLNGKDQLGNDVEHTAGGRKRFTEYCETQASIQRGVSSGLLPFDKVVQAFITSRLTPELTKEEFKAVFAALEVFNDEAQNMVNWRNLLQAPVKREQENVYGIFPKIVSRILSTINHR